MVRSGFSGPCQCLQQERNQASLIHALVKGRHQGPGNKSPALAAPFFDLLCSRHSHNCRLLFPFSCFPFSLFCFLSSFFNYSFLGLCLFPFALVLYFSLFYNTFFVFLFSLSYFLSLPLLCLSNLHFFVSPFSALLFPFSPSPLSL